MQELNEIFKPSMPYLEKSSDGSKVTIEDWHSYLKDITINDSCPQNIIDLYENARNLYLYSYYCYRFCMNYRIQLYCLLELALREKNKKCTSGHNCSSGVRSLCS